MLIMTTISQIFMNRVDWMIVSTAMFTDDTSSARYNRA